MPTPTSNSPEALDHERIWLQPPCCAGEFDGRLWCQDNVFDDGECEDGNKATEYVRADLAAAQITALSERLAVARADNAKLLGWLYEACDGFAVSEQAMVAVASGAQEIQAEIANASQGRPLSEFVSKVRAALTDADQAQDQVGEAS